MPDRMALQCSVPRALSACIQHIQLYIVVLYNYRECVCVVHPVVITCDSNPHLKQQHCDGIAAASRSGHQGLAETWLLHRMKALKPFTMVSRRFGNGWEWHEKLKT